ncbi:MAG TPA: cytochrome c [Candidatus Tumulicola sp.]|nr:cytochrome c [Candidatus Tumulicola sp.]
MKRAVFIVAICLQLASGCTPAVHERSGTAGGTAATYGGDKDAGRLVFAANCSTCHGSTGVEGGAVGPSLRHESSRMDFAATVSWIEDPEPPMPKLYPKVLSASQVRDVAAYVQSL